MAELSKIIRAIDAPTKDDFNCLRNRVDVFENLLAALKKAVSDMDKRMKGLGYAGNDSEQIEGLENQIRKLRRDFDEHAEIAMKQFGFVEQVLPTKADKTELIDLQNQILDKLRDMI